MAFTLCPYDGTDAADDNRRLTQDAAAVNLIRDRNRTPEATSKGEPVKAEMQAITLVNPTCKGKLLRASEAGVDLLAIVKDGVAKDSLNNLNCCWIERL